MDNVLLGNVENNGKTCNWPTEGRAAQAVEIIKEMSKPIPQELLDDILNAPMAKCKSDSLFKLTLEFGLTLDCLPDNLNILMIAQDIDTKESTKLLVAPKKFTETEKLTEFIKMISGECLGTRQENGKPVANELLTIFANVIAQYCAVDPSYKESFLNAIDYWDNINKNEK